MVHIFNPGTWEAEAGRWQTSLNLRLANSRSGGSQGHTVTLSPINK